MTENQTRPLRDFHAKPLEMVILGKDFRYYKVEDVLREREAYEKEIALYKTAMNANAKSAEAAEAELRKLQDTTVPHEEYQAVLGRADRAEGRVKELERRIMDWRYLIQDLSDEYDFYGNDEYKKMVYDMEIEARKPKTLAGEKTK